jgi:hypothetical protein
MQTKIWLGNLKGRTMQRSRSRCRRENNIRMDLGEVGWEGVNWPHPARYGDWLWALMNMVMNLWVP